MHTSYGVMMPARSDLLLFFLCVGVFCGAGSLGAQEKAAVQPVVAQHASANQEPEATTRDVIVFKDGDRVQGKLISRDGDILVFQSDRFGEMRVPASGAVVIRAEKPGPAAVATATPPPPPAPVATPSVALAQVTPAPVTAPAASPAKATVAATTTKPTSEAEAKKSIAAAQKSAADLADAEKVSVWDRFSPAVLTAKMREFFGPWRGKISFSTEVVTDTTERANVSTELQIRRKWKSDEVEMRLRYDFSQTNEVTTTDMVKGNGLWRHEFGGKKAFVLYRPVIEWNRASFKSGVPADYFLLQQEVGVGYGLIVKPSRTVRIGLSENLIDTWGLAAVRSHTSTTSESAFMEAELKLPWRITITDRSVFYYSLTTESGGTGWENNIELSKRFTETLSTAIRHEIRRGSPDSRVQDFTRLRLMIGLDF